MAAKLAVVILVVGATFAALLVNRQQRIDVVAEISRTQLRMQDHARTIQRLHAAVAQRVQPTELLAAIERLPAKFHPIPHRFDPFVDEDRARMAERGERDRSNTALPKTKERGG